jgi:hypothetical protein
MKMLAEDRPDRTGGIIQIRGADGRLRNYKGYTLKDGTKQIAACRYWMQMVVEQFIPVPQGGPIADSDLTVNLLVNMKTS